MSEEGGDHGGNILWANQALAFSNSDNSGGTQARDHSSSNSPRAVAPPTLTVGQKRGRNGKERIDGGADSDHDQDHDHDHELHIWTERERRKKMRNMFSSLHALLPHIPPKVDKATIVDEAVTYIRTLQNTLQKLQSWICSGESRPSGSTPGANQGCSNSSRNNQAIITGNNSAMANSFGVPRFPVCLQTWSSPNVVLSVCGNDAQICVCAPKKPGLLTTIFYIMEKHKLEVVTANISSDNYQSMYMIHAHANGLLINSQRHYQWRKYTS
ncbi:transcription factor bHLH95-like [Macadamia integrifolia]|uniref:transcription factor bHLH95-like n=1 Tax=Macadamia integrifolia TaxID=60698 RepID=UPI001C4F8604|nr:transcription factor bHLH95-like [Macadamia integrifolia]